MKQSRGRRQARLGSGRGSGLGGDKDRRQQRAPTAERQRSAEASSLEHNSVWSARPSKASDGKAASLSRRISRDSKFCSRRHSPATRRNGMNTQEGDSERTVPRSTNGERAFDADRQRYAGATDDGTQARRGRQKRQLESAVKLLFRRADGLQKDKTHRWELCVDVDDPSQTTEGSLPPRRRQSIGKNQRVPGGRRAVSWRRAGAQADQCRQRGPALGRACLDAIRRRL